MPNFEIQQSAGFSNGVRATQEGNVLAGGAYQVALPIASGRTVSRGFVMKASADGPGTIEPAATGDAHVIGFAGKAGVAGDIISVSVGGLVQIAVTGAVPLATYLVLSAHTGYAQSKSLTGDDGVFAIALSTATGGFVTAMTQLNAINV